MFREGRELSRILKSSCQSLGETKKPRHDSGMPSITAVSLKAKSILKPQEVPTDKTKITPINKCVR
jgi:hypothetical protein